MTVPRILLVDDDPGTIHALFNCAGLPGPPFSDVDTMTVNFLAMRHLSELCADRMTEGGAIASIAPPPVATPFPP